MGLEIFMDKDVMNGRTFGGEPLNAYNKAREEGKNHEAAEKVAMQVDSDERRRDGTLSTKVATLGGPGNVIY